MRLLLDTHTLLWWANNDPQLSRAARAHIQEARNRILVSAASVWEIAIKFKNGRLPSAGNFIADLPDYLRGQNFDALPITTEHALRAGLLAGPHRDPFDRMLIAQAIEENATLVSNDQALDAYGASRVW
jgi:PIN domain nuclease of toxin-antitoxin system